MRGMRSGLPAAFWYPVREGSLGSCYCGQSHQLYHHVVFFLCGVRGEGSNLGR